MKLPTRGCGCTVCDQVRLGMASPTTLLPPGRTPPQKTSTNATPRWSSRPREC